MAISAGRKVLISDKDVNDYIDRHPGKLFQWAISADHKGPVPTAAWCDYESLDKLTRGVRLILGVKGRKTTDYVWVLLPKEVPPQKDSETRSETINLEGMVPSHTREEIERLWENLQDRQKLINDDEVKLREEERRVSIQMGMARRAIDIERKELESSRESLNKDRKSIEDSIKDSIQLMKDVDDVFGEIDDLRTSRQVELDALIQRAQRAEQGNMTAATIQHVADRFQLLVSMWKIKSADGIPPNILAEYQEGQTLISLKRYYANVGEGEIQKIVNSVAMFPNSYKVITLKSIFPTMDNSAKGEFIEWLRDMAVANQGEKDE